jgi:hypothetical protein
MQNHWGSQVVENSFGNPYVETKLSPNTVRREFNYDVHDEDLVWHRDREDRRVTVVSGDDWGIQFDNELPQPLHPGDVVFIPKMVYHRLLIGTNDLVIDIDFV